MAAKKKAARQTNGPEKVDRTGAPDIGDCLEFAYGRDGDQGHFLICEIDPEGGFSDYTVTNIGQAQGAALAGSNKRKVNVSAFYNRMVNPASGKKPSLEDVATIRMIIGDFDPPENLKTAAEREAYCQAKIAELEASPLPPTRVHLTGNGVQAFLVLDKEYSILGDNGKGSKALAKPFKDIGLAWARKHGGDKQAADPSMVMRIAGTMNYPNRNKRGKGCVAVLSRTHSYNPEHIYKLEDFDALLAEFPPEPEAAKADDPGSKDKKTRQRGPRVKSSEISDIDDDTVVRVLNLLDPTDREDWRKVGAALHHQYRGDPNGFRIWDNWSHRTRRDNYGGTEEEWAKFDSDKEGGVTFGTLIYLARQIDPTLQISTRRGKRTYSQGHPFYAAEDLMRSSPIKPVFYAGQWYKYDKASNTFVETERAVIFREAVDYCKRRMEIVEKGNQTALINPSPKPRFIEDVVTMVSTLALIPTRRVAPPFWIGDHAEQYEENYPSSECIAVKNGVLHLPTGTLVPEPPAGTAFFTFAALGFEYKPDAPCPEWERFTKGLFPDSEHQIPLLQEATGWITSFDMGIQKIIAIRGAPRVGKGVLDHVWTALLGGTSAIASVTVKDLSDRFGMETLLDKRLINIADLQKELSTHEEGVLMSVMLRVSGRDLTSVPRKGIKNIEVQLPCKIKLSGNEFPTFSDETGAFLQRLIPIDITAESLPDGVIDPKLKEKLTKELPGILNWALVGYRRLMARGHFELHNETRRLIREIGEAKAPQIAQFLKKSTRFTSLDEYVTKTALYDAYERFCRNVLKEPPLKDNAFYRMLPGFTGGQVHIVRITLPNGDRKGVVYGIAVWEIM